MSEAQLPEIGEIVRLVAAERGSIAKTSQSKEAVQTFADWVADLRMHLEHLVDLKVCQMHQGEIIRYANVLRENYDCRAWELRIYEHIETSYGASENRCVKAFFPAMLRGGSYYIPCDLRDSMSGTLVRSLGWRYLAGLLALDKITALDTQRLDTMLNETERMLVGAAKSQRRLRRCLFPPAQFIEGDMTALALAPSKNNYFDSYLVSVNELPAGCMKIESVIARAKMSLHPTGQRDLRHRVFITDDISRHFVVSAAYQADDLLVLLSGDIDNLRFFILVTDIPDHNRPPDPPAFDEGRFRLSRSRLRDAFKGVAEDVSEVDCIDKNAASPTARIAPNILNFPQSTDKEDQTRVAHDEYPVLRGRFARLFFGYNGLPEH